MRTPQTPDERLRRAFTLIELSIVVLIIGILLAFVLAAGAAGLETARVRATQALLTKLNAGLEERLDAVLSTGVTPNGTHLYLAHVTPPGYSDGPGSPPLPWGVQGEQRAQVIARLDQIRAEFPDVFFIDPAKGPGAAAGLYPISFGGLPYPLGATAPVNYVLPLGNSVTPLFKPNTYDSTTTPPTPLFYGSLTPAYGGAFDTTDPANPTNPQGTGFNGASYSAAASLYKVIGYTATGCNGVDDNKDGFVDDYNEGIRIPDGSAVDQDAVDRVNRFLANHQHKTARAEMLYALLVEGVGPLGSVFNTEDFRETEVRDTDNDGAPEFVDGWGEPIQFFRWPVWHRTGQELSTPTLNPPALQKGDAWYAANEPRQQNPLDPGGQLVSVAWWCQDVSTPTVPSPRMAAVQAYFGPLVDPQLDQQSTGGTKWDRSDLTARRAYFTKFLLVSPGPDRQIGMPRLSDARIRQQPALTTSQQLLGALSYNQGWSIVPGEGWAMLLDPVGAYLPAWRDTDIDPTPGTDYALDDMTNQGLQNRAGGLQ